MKQFQVVSCGKPIFQLILCMLVLFGGVVFAGDNTAAEEEDPRISFGGDFRVRILHEDARKLNDTEPANDRLWQRYRARVWSSAELTDNIKHYVTMQAMVPGNYYSDSRADTATWFRYGVEFKF